MKIKGTEFQFLKNLEKDSVFLQITGFGTQQEDNQFRVMNHSTGAGIHCKIDKPQSDMVFWAIKTTLCPEPSILISVDPNQIDEWTSDYTFIVK